MPKRCTAISYNCGAICLSLHKTCRIGNTAIGKDRLDKIKALAQNLAGGGADTRKGIGKPGQTALEKLGRIIDAQQKAEAKSKEKETKSKKQSQAGKVPAEVLKLEDNIRQQRFEALAVFDNEGKQILFKNGAQFTVEVTPSEAAQMKGQIVTHNHPCGWKHPESDPQHIGNSFSSEDLKLAAVAEVAEMRVVAVGHRYSLKPNPETGWNADYYANFMAPTIKKHHQEIKSEFISLIKSSKITLSEANVRHYHELVTRVSKELGLIYTQEVYKPYGT